MLPWPWVLEERTALAAAAALALPRRPCPLAVSAALFDFFFFPLGTFQEPESQCSAGQRAFVRRQAGEGRARGVGSAKIPPAGARGPGLALGRVVSPGSCGPRCGLGFSPKCCAAAEAGVPETPEERLGTALAYKGPLRLSPFARP